MSQINVRGVQGKIRKVALKIWKFKEKMVVAGILSVRLMTGMTVYASGVVNTGVPELDNLINKVLYLAAGFVVAIGIVKIINGIRTWSDAQEEMDQARKSQGMNTIIAGVVCVMVLPILLFLGYAVR